MANPEHLKVIQLGVDAWNQWRLENFDIPPDLSGADLSHLKLHYAQLHAANLERANCWKTELIGADLQGANLTGADLRKAELQAANLSFSTLTGVNMEGAKMATTILGANDLSSVQGLEDVRHSALSIVGIETIYRSNGAIPETFLRGCGVPDHFITYARSLTTKAIDFYSCFISYSSRDQEFAERLHADLQTKGVRCWFAPHDLPIGAKIRPAIDESIRLYDKLLLVLSQHSVSSQWVEQEVETALAREREQDGRTILLPIRIDDIVLKSDVGWPALLKNTRNVGDFSYWKDHDSYLKVFDRLIRDLKAEEKNKLNHIIRDSLLERAVLSPRNTLIEEWDKVESSIVQAAKRDGLVNEGELVSCGKLINQLYEAGKISQDVREDFFFLSKWHDSVAFNSLSSVEPGMAITFVNKAHDLQKAFE